MFNKKTILNAAIAVVLSAGICCGANCEAETQRWKRLVSSTIDILLDRDIEPPYMRGYGFVEPQAAVMLPPRGHHGGMGFMGALAEFVEMLPPPPPPEPTLVLVEHHRPMPGHLHHLKKMEHFHHPVRNVHRPVIVGKHVVPHVIKHKDFVEYHKHKHHGPVAPVVVKDKLHKGPVNPHKLEHGGKKDFRDVKNKGLIDPRKLEQKRKIKKQEFGRNGLVEKQGKNIGKAVLPVRKNISKPVPPVRKNIGKPVPPVRKNIGKPVPPVRKNIGKPVPPARKNISKPVLRNNVTFKKQAVRTAPAPRKVYNKPSTSYKRPQPKTQYKKKSSSSSKKPVYQNNPYVMKKHGK